MRKRIIALAWLLATLACRAEGAREERSDLLDGPEVTPTAADLYPMQNMRPETVRLGGQASRLIRLIHKSMVKVSGGAGQDSIGLAVHRYGAGTMELMGI